MAEGKIVTFKSDRGFGFIDDGGEEERFFHVKEWAGTERPDPGVRVQFTPVAGDRGPRAESVRPAKASQPKKAPEGTIWCGTCEENIRPRLVMEDGEARYNVCPKCGNELRDLRPWLEQVLEVVLPTIALIAVSALILVFLL